MSKTYETINAKIARGEAIVLTAEEFKELSNTASDDELLATVDIVTVATYAPMCSSGVIINFGHGSPPIRMEEVFLNGVPAYGGIAAVDAYLGATAESGAGDGTGGADVIESLVNGRPVRLEASGKGTDCYPSREVATWITKDDLNHFAFFNPRNVYQNYGAAANSGKRELRTYLGVLEPECATVSYATSGELSPLLNDPEGRAIGTGTPAFVAGAKGAVIGPGTQCNTSLPVDGRGLPASGARTLALYADAKKANPEFVSAARISGYGISLFVGVGFALPVLDLESVRRLKVRNADIPVVVRDYAKPDHPVLLETDYGALRSGEVTIRGARARTSCSSSIAKARKICDALKAEVLAGRFAVAAPTETFPAGLAPRPLAARGEPVGRSCAEPARAGKAGFARSLCVDCGACAAHCKTGALAIGAPSWTLRYDDGKCAACGACEPACPRRAFVADAKGAKRGN